MGTLAWTWPRDWLHKAWRCEAGTALIVGGLVLVAALAWGHSPANATGENAPDQLLRVGATGIMCVKLPCPSRGVFLPSVSGLNARRQALLYTDADGKSGPPEFTGAPDIRQTLNRAWRSLECLEILGRLDSKGPGRATLHVSRILGTCQ